MSYFLIDKNLNLAKEVSMSGEEARHIILSRRTKINDTIFIQDPKARRFECKVTKISKSELSFFPLKELATPPEPHTKIQLFQALISSEALDLLIQKATELGASEVSIFHADFSPYSFNSEEAKKKIERWQKIAWEAAKQSNRVAIPNFSYFKNITEVLSEKKKNLFFASIKTKDSLTKLLLKKNIKELTLLIGPEGGFSEGEQVLLEKFATPFSLGPRVLRAETASIASLAIASSIASDMA